MSGVPHVQFDGIYPVVGAGGCESAANQYRARINSRLTETGGIAPVDIQGSHMGNDELVTVAATFRKDNADPIYNTRAFLLVLENNIYYGGNYYSHITRAAYEQDVSIPNEGDMVIVQHTFVNNGWNVENLDVIGFIQKMTYPYEVYQAAHLPFVLDFDFTFDPAIASVPEGNGTAEFHGICTNISDSADNLTFALNNPTGWSAEFMVEGDPGYHTDPVTVPLGVGESVEVWMRVTTDSDLRVATCFIDASSEVSERTQPTPGRVFNGSPAILVVDDDGTRTDEILVLNALDDAGLLYDDWDCYNDHGETGPDGEDMNGYDVILWHSGWGTLNIMSLEDQSNVMDFIDAGGGFILSSQSFLETDIDPVFLSDYLGITSWESNVGAEQAIGIGGDPITDGMGFVIDYPQFWWDRTDDVTPNALSTVIFESETATNIAIRNENGRSGRSVFFAFPINGMDPGAADPNNPKTLLARAVEFVKPASGQSVDDHPVVSLPSAVHSISPNPLGGGRTSTTLRLRISERAAQSPAQLDLVDLNGRLVRNLVSGQLPAGISSLTWDGRDARGNPVGAGIYYLNLTTTEGQDGAKLVVIH